MTLPPSSGTRQNPNPSPTPTSTPSPGPGPAIFPPPTPTPSSPYAPSPLTPTGITTRPRLGPRRLSRFTEEAMTARTPAASVSEPSFDQYWFGRSAESVDTNTEHDNADHRFAVSDGGGGAAAAAAQSDAWRRRREMWARVVNGGLHAVPCVVLLALVGCGIPVLRGEMGSYMSIQAILLICFLSFDVLLDVFTLLRAQAPWPTWGLALRCVCGTAYIVLSLVSVGLGGVFPQGHTYWGMSADSASTAVYVLLCAEGLWNFLPVPFTRYQLGRSLLLLGRTVPPPEAKSTSSPLHHHTHRDSFTNPRFSVAGTEYSSISLTWRRWVRTRSTQYSREDLTAGGGLHRATGSREPSVDLTLRERPGEEDDDGACSSRRSSSRQRHGEREADEEAGLPKRGDKLQKEEEDKLEEGGRPYPVRSADIGQ